MKPEVIYYRDSIMYHLSAVRDMFEFWSLRRRLRRERRIIETDITPRSPLDRYGQMYGPAGLVPGIEAACPRGTKVHARIGLREDSYKTVFLEFPTIISVEKFLVARGDKPLIFGV